MANHINADSNEQTKEAPRIVVENVTNVSPQFVNALTQALVLIGGGTIQYGATTK